jgi:hypothetical protein
MKCLALMSGGLDSFLAVKVIQAQGIDVLALHARTPFGVRVGGGAPALAAAHGIPLRELDLGDELFRVVEKPKHGRGGHMNPCIDCHALMFRRAAELFPETGARFVISGEVLGQRPMSQHRAALRIVEEESGLPGLILRPLSAKLLAPTIPETEGWVDREKLLDIGGRTRTRQLAMAKEFGLMDPPTPAGGCLLTDGGYSDRLSDLLGHVTALTDHLARVIRSGRYVRLSPGTFVMVGRNERDNAALEGLQQPDEWIMRPVNCVGPVVLGVGPMDDGQKATAAGMLARYADAPADGRVELEARHGPAGAAERMEARRP